jgi:hypothetical protein
VVSVAVLIGSGAAVPRNAVATWSCADADDPPAAYVTVTAGVVGAMVGAA